MACRRVRARLARDPARSRCSSWRPVAAAAGRGADGGEGLAGVVVLGAPGVVVAEGEGLDGAAVLLDGDGAPGAVELLLLLLGDEELVLLLVPRMGRSPPSWRLTSRQTAVYQSLCCVDPFFRAL